MKKALIFLSSTAVVLGIVTYIAVFYNIAGSYPVSSSNIAMTSTNPISSSTSLALASGTASSTASSSASTTQGFIPGSGSGSSSSTNFSSAPLSWKEGNETFSIIGVALNGNQLVFSLEIDMGPQMECVPVNMRLLVDERGDLASPVTTQFAFPETGTCEGAPGATYAGQDVVFTIDPASFPLYFTTGGSSNIFFSAATTTAGGFEVLPPPTSG